MLINSELPLSGRINSPHLYSQQTPAHWGLSGAKELLLEFFSQGPTKSRRIKGCSKEWEASGALKTFLKTIGRDGDISVFTEHLIYFLKQNSRGMRQWDLRAVFPHCSHPWQAHCKVMNFVATQRQKKIA